MATKENEIALAEKKANALVFDTVEHFELAQRICQCLITANMLPKQFCGEQNFGNCMLALEIAQRAKLPVMEVFQNLYVVNGKTSWASQYLIGRVNTNSRFSGMRWDSEHEGTKQWRMRAKSIDTRTGEELIGEWVSLEMAEKEKWGAKWQTMPGQMLRYRSAAFWVRVYAPDIAMGIPMYDEVEDLGYAEVVETAETENKKTAAANALITAIGKKKPQPEPVVSIVVEQEGSEAGEEAERKPNKEAYQAELEKSLKNLGIKTPNEGDGLPFPQQ
jgi:hypothetical protein